MTEKEKIIALADKIDKGLEEAYGAHIELHNLSMAYFRSISTDKEKISGKAVLNLTHKDQVNNIDLYCQALKHSYEKFAKVVDLITEPHKTTVRNHAAFNRQIDILKQKGTCA